jgi:type II secretion system (T2SS) protein C
MQFSLPGRRGLPSFMPLAERWLPALATALALLLLGWLVSGWVLAWATPRLAPSPGLSLPSPAQAAKAIAARHLFGMPPAAGSAVAPGAAPSLPYRLLGVAAVSEGGAGFAILAADGKPPAFAMEGEAISPGLVLRRVFPDRVEIQRGVATEVLRLSEKHNGAAAESR